MVLVVVVLVRAEVDDEEVEVLNWDGGLGGCCLYWQWRERRRQLWQDGLDSSHLIRRFLQVVQPERVLVCARRTL